MSNFSKHSKIKKSYSNITKEKYIKINKYRIKDPIGLGGAPPQQKKQKKESSKGEL